jgi:hypothetical protein
MGLPRQVSGHGFVERVGGKSGRAQARTSRVLPGARALMR